MLSYALSHVQTVACFDDETNLPRPNALNATKWHHLSIIFLFTLLFCFAVCLCIFLLILNSTEVYSVCMFICTLHLRHILLLDEYNTYV